MRACKHKVQTLAHPNNHVSANTNAWLFVLVAICVTHRALSFTSDVDEFLFLYHLCFSSFSYLCFSLSLPHPLSLCPSVFTRGRGLSFTSARVLVRAHVGGPGFPRTGTVDHTLCVIRAVVPTLACAAPHVCVCVIAYRDWAVSIGSHMREDTDISEAAFTSENHDTKD